MGPEAVKEEIRERVDLVELISQYVELKQAGRNWKGLCPFHPEKTPSFNVNRESRFWKCFGCGLGGDVFSFVMRAENLSFPEAARMLADRVGLAWEMAPARPEERDEREEVLRANALALEWFREQLPAQVGTPARAYLAARGLDEATVARFRIGYAPPGWDGLLTRLSRHGIGHEAAVRAGLAKRSEQGGVYDVFRNRIIFPICDVAGKVIAFGGRAMDPDDPAKYLNSPETPVFHKGRTFYGLDLARRAIAEAGHAIVVEGYMDVIALVQHGIEPVVATLGTSLTDQHARVLGRYTPEIVLLYDADAAGMAAALRSVKAFEDCPAAVKVVALPEGKDPDDAVREWGAEGFRELLDQRIGLVEYRLRMIFARHEGTGPEARTQAAREALDVLSEVPDIPRRMALLAWAADAWAGSDVGRAAFLERALLQELQRRARGAAPGERDEWQKVLMERGLTRAAAGGNGRRLSRSEWLALQQRHEPLLRNVQVARGAGLTPHAPDSPTNADFIGAHLSRGASPHVMSAVRLERRMLTAMLQRSEAATALLGQIRPEELLLPIHREIATAVAGADAENSPERLASVTERLAQDEAVFAAAVEIGVAEDDYDLAELEGHLAYLREVRLLGGGAPRRYRPSDERPDALHEGESLGDLERQVQERLAAGSLADDDPLYQRYMAIKRQLHGSGELPQWDVD